MDRSERPYTGSFILEGVVILIQTWFLSPNGMLEAVFCGRRYEIVAEGVDARTSLWWFGFWRGL